MPRSTCETKRGERAHRLLSAIIDSSDDAIISKDLNGIITSWNKSAERLFGYTAAEAVGKPITILIPRIRLTEEPEIIARIKSGERVDDFETLRKRKDGTLLDISQISPVRDSAAESWGLRDCRDITETGACKTRWPVPITTWSNSRSQRVMTYRNPCAASKSTASY